MNSSLRYHLKKYHSPLLFIELYIHYICSCISSNMQGGTRSRVIFRQSLGGGCRVCSIWNAYCHKDNGIFKSWDFLSEKGYKLMILDRD
ncbi:hypothetical protein SUGI_0072710 [Cryptomeria japonica]|nr:hypothetical protein SUGI_0072710 [Cryptomeria japonica]